jgi:hypothetical protein
MPQSVGDVERFFIPRLCGVDGSLIFRVPLPDCPLMSGCPPPWPCGETRIHTSEPLAISRTEPWPQVLNRQWPDGVKGLPWLPWLLGHKRRTSQSRIVVRRMDGSPVLRLHEPEPIFRRTAGIFDADDVRVGYLGGAFKGGGEGLGAWDTSHQLVGHLTRSGSTHRFASPDGAQLGEIISADQGYAVTAQSDRSRDRLFLLAATLVLMAWGMLPKHAA